MKTEHLQHLKGIVHSDSEILSGTPVFVGTRVPLQNLVDSLEGGESIEDFLDGFPSVKREQALAVIEAGKLALLELAARSQGTQLHQTLPLMAGVLAVLPTLAPGAVVFVS